MCDQMRCDMAVRSYSDFVMGNPLLHKKLIKQGIPARPTDSRVNQNLWLMGEDPLSLTESARPDFDYCFSGLAPLTPTWSWITVWTFCGISATHLQQGYRYRDIPLLPPFLFKFCVYFFWLKYVDLICRFLLRRHQSPGNGHLFTSPQCVNCQSGSWSEV